MENNSQSQMKVVFELLVNQGLKKMMDDLFSNGSSSPDPVPNTKKVEIVPNQKKEVVVNSYFDCYVEKKNENWNSDERLEMSYENDSTNQVILNKLNKQQQQLDSLMNMLSCQSREIEALKQVLSKKDREISMLRCGLSDIASKQQSTIEKAHTYTESKIVEMSNSENIKLHIIEQDEEEEEQDEVEQQEEEEEQEQEEQEEEEEQEEQEEEEVEEQEEDEVEQKEEVEEQEKQKQEEEEEEELYEIEIDNITYCTNDEENGFIYEMTKDGDVGKKVGYFKDSDCIFY
jgi:cobalamin biosynthesis protein CobT